MIVQLVVRPGRHGPRPSTSSASFQRRSCPKPSATVAGISDGLDTSEKITVAVDRPTAFAIVRDRCASPAAFRMLVVARGRPDRYTDPRAHEPRCVHDPQLQGHHRRGEGQRRNARSEDHGGRRGAVGHCRRHARMDLAETADRTPPSLRDRGGLTGKLGSLGQPVLRATSAKLAREFGANLKAEIEKEHEPSA